MIKNNLVVYRIPALYEILSELETKLKEIDEFYEVHELSEEQLNDEEYIESLYNNYKENK